MPPLLRALAALVLLTNVAVGVYVLVGVGRDAPGWVAMHYAPTRAEDRCEATIARLRAVIRQRRHADPTAQEEAMFRRLREDGRCDAGDVAGIEARLGE